jgi:hypothetical protein
MSYAPLIGTPELGPGVTVGVAGQWRGFEQLADFRVAFDAVEGAEDGAVCRYV